MQALCVGLFACQTVGTCTKTLYELHAYILPFFRFYQPKFEHFRFCLLCSIKKQEQVGFITIHTPVLPLTCAFLVPV